MIMNASYEDQKIINLIESFESCRLKPEEFTHQAHLTVGLWYLIKMPLPQAISAFRSSLHQFASHYNLKGYNETITVFWMRLLDHHLRSKGSEKPLSEQVNEVLNECSNSKIIYKHYSKDYLSSDMSKLNWQEPDLMPLEF